MDLTPDTTKLTAEQRDKLDLYNMSKSQGDALKALEQKMASFTPEMQMKISNLADLKQDLTPILDALKALEAKEQPDTTPAIVDAVGKLEKALGAIDFKPNFTPEVKVDAPQVNVTAPKVNLTGVEKAVKDVSSAVKDAIAQIPTVDVPETDFTPLLEKLDLVLKQLSDIDTGVRLKPAPGTMKVSNLTDVTMPVSQQAANAPAGTPMQTDAVANGTGDYLNVSGYATALIHVLSSTAISGGTTINFEASVDGTTWTAISATLVGSATSATTATADGDYVVSVTGFGRLRTRISAYSAGKTTIIGYPTVLTASSGGGASGSTTVTGDVSVVGNVAAGATDSGNPVKIGGVQKTTPPTLTDGQRGDAQLDTRANIKVSLWSPNTGTAQTYRADNADAVAASGTAGSAQSLSRNTVFNGSTWDRMSGDTTGINIKNIVGTIVPGTGATNLGKAEDAVHVSGDTGVAILGVRDDTLNATSGTEGDYEMIHTTATGAIWVTQAPSTSGGWSTAMMSSADGSTALTATAQAIKASAGTFGGYYIYNPNSSATYVHIYNVAFGSVTVGTTNPQCTFCIPATSGANLEIGNGVNFTTAMSAAATTTGGGNTAPATALEAVFWFA